MIFITVGTQKFSFNRLFKIIDELIEQKIITDEVFAQIGHSKYQPKNFKYTRFLNSDEFKNYVNKCNIYITHGGVGSIHYGLELNKKTIVFPRLKKYKEHIDDHQMEIAKKYYEFGYCLIALNQKEIIESLSIIQTFKSKYIPNTSNSSNISSYILKYIEDTKYE